MLIGAAEVALAGWMLSGRRPRRAAAAQTALLLGMNAGGLLFAGERIERRVLRALPSSPFARVATVAVLAGPAMVALGFTVVPVAQVGGAVLLTAGLWLLAGLTLVRVVPTVTATARVLLTVSSLSVLVPMLLAVQWALGANLGTPALSIADMARTHGVLNAFGFALTGIVGWLVARTGG